MEWLETLDNGAECRRIVVSSKPGFATRRLDNSHCQPSCEWVHLSNQVAFVALLFYVHGKHLRSCRDGQLT